MPSPVVSGWTKLNASFAWTTFAAGVWFFAVCVVWLSLIGDWDDPHPPNPIAAWSVALASMAAILLIAWRLRFRVVRYVALASLPLQFAWWLFMIPKAGIPN